MGGCEVERDRVERERESERESVCVKKRGGSAGGQGGGGETGHGLRRDVVEMYVQKE